MRVDVTALAVLDKVRIEGNNVYLPDQLERDVYVKVNKALVAAGGKWNRRLGAHVFPSDPSEAIEQMLLTGQITTAQDFGYFPTPPRLVEQLIAAIDLKPGMHVLEPSAGQGAIAKALREYGCEVDCIEVLESNADVIRAGGFARNLVVGDFLDMTPERRYDAVVMNPPFRSQADVRHVLHALDFLKPGGRLAAIMSSGATFRQTAVTETLQNIVGETNGSFVRLPDNAFVSSGTQVSTVMLTIKDNSRIASRQVSLGGASTTLIPKHLRSIEPAPASNPSASHPLRETRVDDRGVRYRIERELGTTKLQVRLFDPAVGVWGDYGAAVSTSTEAFAKLDAACPAKPTADRDATQRQPPAVTRKEPLTLF